MVKNNGKVIEEEKRSIRPYYNRAQLDLNFNKQVIAETIYSLDRLEELCNVENTKSAYDSETTGLAYFKDYAVGFSFAFNGLQGYYCPINHVNNDGTLADYNVDKVKAIDILYNKLLKRNNILMYNAIFDLTMIGQELHKIGCRFEDIEDIKFIDVINYVYTLESEIKRNGLKWASRHFLGRISPEFEQITGISKRIKKGGIEHFGYLHPDEQRLITPKLHEVKGNKKYLTEDEIQENNDQLALGEYYATPAQYAVHDAINTFALYEYLEQFITKYFLDFKKQNTHDAFVTQIDNNLTKSMLHYVHTPISIDADLIKKYKKETEEKIESIETELFTIVGRVFNPDSVKDKREILQQFNINTGVNTKTGMSVAKDLLDEIDHPFCKAISKRASLNKQLTSYYNALCDNYVGRINYRTTGVSTGRLSSGKDSGENNYFLSLSGQTLTKLPPAIFRAIDVGEQEKDNILGWKFEQIDIEYMKNHPEEKYIEGFQQEYSVRNALCSPHKIYVNDGDTKHCFMYDYLKAEEFIKTHNIPYENIEFEKNNDWHIVGIDFASEEIRLMGNCSGETAFIQPFLDGKDPHKEMARKMFHNFDEVDPSAQKKNRSAAKACNFGLGYKGSYRVLLNDVPDEIEAMRLFNLWWSAVPQYKSWQDMKINEMVYEKDGTIINHFGRMRRLKTYLMSTQSDQAYACRTAANFLIQSVGGDAIRKAMYEIYKLKFYKNKFYNEVRFIASVHDELVFAIKKDCLLKHLYDILEIMENSFSKSFVCPMLAEPQIGFSYGNGYNFVVTRDEKFKIVRDNKLVPKFI